MIATVSSPEKAERARAGGASHVINYRQEDVAARVLDITNGVGVDHIAEVDFGGNLVPTLRCLQVNGSIMIYASNGDREPKVPVRELMQKNLTVFRCPLPAFRIRIGGEHSPTLPLGRRRRAASCRSLRVSRSIKRPLRTRQSSGEARLAPSSSNRSFRRIRC